MRILKSNLLIIGITGLLTGCLIASQLFLTQKSKKIQNSEDNQVIALEISQLIEANAKLRLELNELKITQEKFSRSLEDRKSAEEELKKSLEKYKIAAGITKIEGPGVRILIEGEMVREQFVDLINALRNIGAEGISINGYRFGPRSFFMTTGNGIFVDNRKITSPYIIEVIGNSALLKESLMRRGGVIEQIKTGDNHLSISVEEASNIQLNPLQ